MEIRNHNSVEINNSTGYCPKCEPPAETEEEEYEINPAVWKTIVVISVLVAAVTGVLPLAGIFPPA